MENKESNPPDTVAEIRSTLINLYWAVIHSEGATIENVLEAAKLLAEITIKDNNLIYQQTTEAANTKKERRSAKPPRTLSSND